MTTWHLLTACLVLALAPLWCSAATYFVSPRGDDGQDGSESRPFRTIQKGADRLRPGDTLVVAPGVYRESVKLGKLEGTADMPIVIRAAVPRASFLFGSVTLGGWQKVPGTRCTYRASLARPTRLVYERDTNREYIERADPYGVDESAASFMTDEEAGAIYVHTSDDAAPEKHLIDACIHEMGFDLYSGGPADWHISLRKHIRIEGFVLAGYAKAGIHFMRADSCEVRDCVAHHCGAGIFMHSSIRSAIRDCEAAWCYDRNDNEGGGIAFRGTGFDNVIERCVVHDVVKSGIRHYGGGFLGGVIRDCLTYRIGRMAIQTKGKLDEKREWADRFSPPGSNLPLLVERNVAVEKATQRTSLMDCWGLRRNTMGFLENPNYRGGPNEAKATQLAFDPAKVEDSRFADPASRDYRLQSDSPHRGKTVGAFEYRGDVFFVKPDGNDAAEGASVATAWKDASVAAARLKPGQTLYVLPGRYAASATLRLGSPPIQLRKRGVGEVVFDGRGKAACALDVDGEGELQIRGLRFVGYGEAAVRSRKAARLMIHECVFDGNAGNAVAADGPARIEKSVFCGSKAAAIRAGAGLLQVYGCVFWRNAVAFDAAQPLLSNFNCFDGKVAPHAAELAAWQRASGQDSESIAADPQFANPSDGHFALAKSSPCWGRGYGWSPMGLGETPHHWFDSTAELRFEDVRASLVTPTMANLTWRVVGGQATALVRYGESRDQLDRVIARTTGQHLASVHAVTLFDLRPGATYHFQVGRAPYQMLYADNVEEPMDASPTVWDSAVHSFKTPTTFTPKRRTLHVSKAKGNDANDGFSAATAFASLHKAATVAEPGDRVVIGAGEYFGVLRPVHSGTPDAPIVFEAAPGERVELSGKRLTEPRGALLLDKRHIVLRGFVFKEQCKMLQDDVGGGAQLMIGDSRDITVEDCLFDGRMYYMAAAWVFRSGDIRFRHNVIYNASNYTALILGLNDGPLVFERNAFYSGGTSFGHVMGNAEVVFLNNIFGEKIRVKWGQPKFWLADTGKLVLDYNYYAFDDANQDRYALQVRPKRDSTPVESRGADPLAAARALGLERNGRVGPLPWANADRIAQKSATVRGVEPRLQNLQPLELGDFALKPDAACHGMASDGGAPGRR